MPRKSVVSPKAERDQLRERMRGLGCSAAQIAAEMARRFNLRPRVAWRHALGWTQWKLAQEYNTAHPGAKLSDNRVSEYESWPHGGVQPSVRYLANLAAVLGCGCTPSQLVDADDLEHLGPADRSLFTTPPHGNLLASPVTAVTPTSSLHSMRSDTVHFDLGPANLDVAPFPVRGGRRVVRCDARGLPIREEVVMAADESAQFRRWSATTNVDDDVLEQMAADIADIAVRYLIDPPAPLFSRLLGARDDVFALIAGRQQPKHTMDLYKVAGQICALLAHATADLGHGHAAHTHARTALHCAEQAGYTPLRVYIRWVQSNVAYWDGRFHEAAQLVEAALPDANGGTALLRLASQQARINAARRRPGDVKRALAIAESAPAEAGVDEPGVLAFAPGKAAYYASEAHRELGGTVHMDAAVAWAVSAVDQFTAEARPNAQFVAAARFDLARAHLARGDLDAVGEHLSPVLWSTVAEHRTVPVMSRARSLSTLLEKRSDVASRRMVSLRDDLADFCAHPAVGPDELESGQAG
jgi:transcriptional regulator with XRE-family HTH domain